MTILLVDGNSIAWRAYHAGEYLSHNGHPTGMAYRFLRMLRVAVFEMEATQCAVAWDAGPSEYRRKIFPAYKAKPSTRSRDVIKDFAFQQRWLLKVLPWMGVSSMACPRWEADDLIGLWATLTVLMEKSSVIFSGDRDAWQLVCKEVRVLSPRIGVFDLKNFEKRTGFTTPQQWLKYRALTGDASDNVPGVGRIGEKRGKELSQLNGKAWDYATQKYSANLTRNFQLMNLGVSSILLRDELASKRLKPMRWDKVQDLGRARKALVDMGMHSLVSKWLQWAEPFRELV